MSYLKQLWEKIPLEWRKEITSFSHTFVATFVAAVVFDLKTNELPMTWGAVGALATAAFRAGIKAAFNKVVLKK